jgi:hypothetical protein
MARSVKITLPSDLAGVTAATFDRPQKSTIQAALGPACTSIEHQVRRLGSLENYEIKAWWWTKCQDDGLTEGPDLFLTVVNGSSKEVPRLNVHVFPRNSKLEQITETTPTLLPAQYAMYRFITVEPDGQPTEFAKALIDIPKEEISVRIFMDNSTEPAVLIDFQLGLQLHQHLIKIFGKV